jgi:hypothetical protein
MPTAMSHLSSDTLEDIHFREKSESFSLSPCLTSLLSDGQDFLRRNRKICRPKFVELINWFIHINFASQLHFRSDSLSCNFQKVKIVSGLTKVITEENATKLYKIRSIFDLF